MTESKLANSKEIYILLLGIWEKISNKRKVQFYFLLIIMLLASLSEVISIGAVIPFLAALTNPEKILQNPYARPILQLLDIHNSEQLLFPFAAIFGIATIISGALRLLLIWCSNFLSGHIGMDIGLDIYRRTLYQPYINHVQGNSGEVVVGIISGTSNAVFAMTMAITLISSIILLIAISATLIAINPLIAITIMGLIGVIYITIIWLTRRKLGENSVKISRNSKSVMRVLQEGLGGIRDVIIDGSQDEYCRAYKKYDVPMRAAMAESNFISQGPRYLVEALGMLIIVCLSYFLVKSGFDHNEALLLLGGLALGAQRLLPILQQGYAAWTSILGVRVSLEDVLSSLNRPLPLEEFFIIAEKLKCEERIELRNIWYRYSAELPWIFKELNLIIRRGERIGFIGKTGGGKSTLVDIIMGLLQPVRGTVIVDDNEVSWKTSRSWQKNIAHVPQFIFLADKSIASNIAFGEAADEIDHERVVKAATAAQLSDFIETLPEKYLTNVGERGVKLSGGQRQRIGIARALYKNPDVIILDEATSALDSETESAVMQSIEAMSEHVTILIIAHRVGTLRMCSRLIKVSDQGLTDVSRDTL